MVFYDTVDYQETQKNRSSTIFPDKIFTLLKQLNTIYQVCLIFIKPAVLKQHFE